MHALRTKLLSILIVLSCTLPLSLFGGHLLSFHLNSWVEVKPQKKTLELELLCVKDYVGLAFPTTFDVQVELRQPNGSLSIQNVVLTRVFNYAGSDSLPVSKRCFSSTSSYEPRVELASYRGSLDYGATTLVQVGWETGPFLRTSAIENLFYPSNTNFYLEHNTYRAPTSFMNQDSTTRTVSAYFEDIYAHVCTQSRGYQFPPLKKEPEDSLYVVRTSAVTNSSSNPQVYASGFSAQNPLGSFGTLQLDSKTGAEHVDLNLGGYFVLAYEVYVYKPNANGQFELYAKNYFERFIVGFGQCTPQVPDRQLRFSLDSTVSFSAACTDTSLKVYLPEVTNLSSVHPDGSDFTILDSAGNLVPIFSAEAVYEVTTNSKYVILQHDRYKAAGQHSLVVRLGNDLNTLLTHCGDSVPFNSTVNYPVVSCPSNWGVGLEDVDPFEGFNLYPNPTNGNRVLYDFPQAVEILLFDGQGRLILQQKLEAGHGQIDLPSLPPGMYGLKLRKGNEYVHLKLMLSQP